MEHINKNTSKDQKLANYIKNIIKLFDLEKIEYAMIGSVGVQANFDYFWRLPNDLDIVIRKKDHHKTIALFEGIDCKVIEKKGKLEIRNGELPIHIIPEELILINKTQNSIRAVVDLSSFFSSTVTLRAKFLNANDFIKLKALPLEVNLYLELDRSIYTESIMTIYFIFRHLVVDCPKFVSIMEKNIILSKYTTDRLNEYSKKLDSLLYCSREDIQIAQKQIELLSNYILQHF